MLKSLKKPFSIFLAFAAGAFLPQAAEFTWIIRYLLMFMLFTVFLRTRFDQLKPKQTHWRLLAANLAVGLLAWGILLLTGSVTLSQTAFFTGIIPTATAAPVVMKFLEGNTEFVVTAFLINNAGIALSLVVLIPLVTGNFTIFFLLRVLLNLLFLIGIPMCLALLVRRFFKSAQDWANNLSGLSFAAWDVMLFLTAASASHFIRGTAGLSLRIVLEIALLSAVICCVNFTLGYWISEKEYRQESSQSLGQKNTMLLLYLALTFGGPLPALGPTFYVFWHNLWNAWQMYRHDRKKLQQKS